MDDKILDWVLPAEKFSQDGDPQSMQAVAREILELDKNSAEGLAIMAEAAFYLGNVQEAQSLAQYALAFEPKHLRGRLVTGGVAIKNFQLKAQLQTLADVIADAHIYDRHVPIIEKMLTQTPVAAPKFTVDPTVTDFYSFTPASFTVEGYTPAPFEDKIPVAI